jgi:hypothetical protein
MFEPGDLVTHINSFFKGRIFMIMQNLNHKIRDKDKFCAIEIVDLATKEIFSASAGCFVLIT